MLEWSGQWVVFVDLMLQIQVLGHSGSMLRLPTRITKLEINPAVQDNYIEPVGDKLGEYGSTVCVLWQDQSSDCKFMFKSGGTDMERPNGNVFRVDPNLHLGES